MEKHERHGAEGGAQDVKTGIDAQVAEVLEKHPDVGKALELFGLSYRDYDTALNALYGPRFIQSNCTVVEDDHANKVGRNKSRD